MVKGKFTLTLSCDEFIDNEGRCVQGDVITASTRMEAKAQAREQGWIIQKSNKCLCPKHADEHRERGFKS